MAKSTALALSKGRNSPQFNKHERNLRPKKKISYRGNEFHVSSPALTTARVSWTPVHVHVLGLAFLNRPKPKHYRTITKSKKLNYYGYDNFSKDHPNI